MRVIATPRMAATLRAAAVPRHDRRVPSPAPASPASADALSARPRSCCSACRAESAHGAACRRTARCPGPMRARLRRAAFSVVEPRAIDRLERQLRLEPRVRRRCPAPRSLQRALAVEIGTVALEAQQTGRAGSASGGAIRRRVPFQRLAAAGTQRLRAFAFELPAWKRNPFVRTTSLSRKNLPLVRAP